MEQVVRRGAANVLSCEIERSWELSPLNEFTYVLEREGEKVSIYLIPVPSEKGAVLLVGTVSYENSTRQKAVSCVFHTSNRLLCSLPDGQRLTVGELVRSVLKINRSSLWEKEITSVLTATAHLVREGEESEHIPCSR